MGHLLTASARRILGIMADEYSKEADHRAEMLAKTRTLREPKHEIYCRERVAGASRAKAYAVAFDLPQHDKKAMASYSARGSRLEKRVPEVLLRIDALQKQLAAAQVNRAAVSQDYVRDVWRDIIEYGRELTPLLDRDGNPVLEPVYGEDGQPRVDKDGAPVMRQVMVMRNPKEVNTAATAAARSLGMFHHAGNQKDADNPSELSDEELMRQLADAEKGTDRVRAALTRRAEAERRESATQAESSAEGSGPEAEPSVRPVH